MTRTCCAHGCKSSTKRNPGLKFYDLSQARGSLAEWLAAFPRRYRVDIVADVTAGNTDAYIICEEHFADSQRCQTPDAEGIFFNCDKSTQTDLTNSLAKLMISPVEIVDIQPDPQILMAGNMNPTIDTNYIPAFLTTSNIQPVLDGINIGAYRGLAFNSNSPQHEANIVRIPEFISNIRSVQPHSENIQIPAFLTNNNDMLPSVRSFEPVKPQCSFKKQIVGRATNLRSHPVMIRPKTQPKILRKVSKNMSELITNANVSSPNLQPNINVVNISGIPKPAVDSVYNPILVEDTNAIQQSSDTHNSGSIDNVPSDVSIKVEDVNDRTPQENIDSDDRKSVELQSVSGQEEHRSDIIEIAFSPTGGSYATSQGDENVEDYVKFEVDQPEEGNIETYSFFEDDSVKRRKVGTDSEESDFRIVKVEIDSEQNNVISFTK